MKNSKLPKGIVITGALITSMALATGCGSNVDDFNPAMNNEICAYGPVEIIADIESTEIEETETDFGDVTLEYGVIEEYDTFEEPEADDEVESDNTEDSESEFGEYNPEDDPVIDVYGPPEDMGGDEDGFEEGPADMQVIAVYGPPEDMGNGN